MDSLAASVMTGHPRTLDRYLCFLSCKVFDYSMRGHKIAKSQKDSTLSSIAEVIVNSILMNHYASGCWKKKIKDCDDNGRTRTKHLFQASILRCEQ